MAKSDQSQDAAATSAIEQSKPPATEFKPPATAEMKPPPMPEVDPTAVYEIAPGHSISTLRGFLHAGAEVSARDFHGGAPAFAMHVRVGSVVRR